MSGKLFVVSSPSGGGKTSLVAAVLQEITMPLERVITYTSRLPRPGEVQGKDYFFLTSGEFEQKIAQDFFMEWSVAYQTFYGTPISIIDEVKNGKNYIVVVDIVGVESIKSVYNQALALWIMPPSVEELRKRLELRGHNSKEDMEHRLQLAQKEMIKEQGTTLFDYKIINNEFEVAKKQLKDILEISIKSSK